MKLCRENAWQHNVVYPILQKMHEENLRRDTAQVFSMLVPIKTPDNISIHISTADDENANFMLSYAL